MVLVFFAFPKTRIMRWILTILTAISVIAAETDAQSRFLPIHDARRTLAAIKDGDTLALMPPVDSVPNVIPDFLPPGIFIPSVRLVGLNPWTSAPLPRPVVEILKVNGFDGAVGFGEYSIQHPDKFYSTLEGYNSIDIPRLYS